MCKDPVLTAKILACSKLYPVLRLGVVLCALFCAVTAAPPSVQAAGARTDELGAHRPKAAAPSPLTAKKSAYSSISQGGSKSGPSGFSSNPFALTHRDPPEKKPDGGRVVYGPGTQENQPGDGKEEGTVTFSSGSPAGQQNNRLIPRRSAFSGGQHTMATIDANPPPEVSMTYKMNENASTRVTVNPQDQTSPLYRPVEQDGTINSAGVYMNIDMQPNLQLQVGGEYCEVNENNINSSKEEASRGAAVGLKWSF